jgi:hypothetical protein
MGFSDSQRRGFCGGDKAIAPLHRINSFSISKCPRWFRYGLRSFLFLEYLALEYFECRVPDQTGDDELG